VIICLICRIRGGIRQWVVFRYYSKNQINKKKQITQITQINKNYFESNALILYFLNLKSFFFIFKNDFV
jgi:hypothetical protein